MVPTIPNIIATVSVSLLEDDSELGWMVATADGRRAVAFVEGCTNAGMSLIGGTVVDGAYFSYWLATAFI